MIIREERYSIHLDCRIFAFKTKETECNGLHSIEVSKFRKQVQRGGKSNVRVSRLFKKRCQIYYQNMTLIYLANAGCLVDPENAEISLLDPKKPEFHMILCPGP